MRDLCSLLWCAVVGLFRSRVVLQAEILVLRHQLNVLRRKSAKRVALGNMDRVVLIGLYRCIFRSASAGFSPKRLNLRARRSRAGYKSFSSEMD